MDAGGTELGGKRAANGAAQERPRRREVLQYRKLHLPAQELSVIRDRARRGIAARCVPRTSR
jgi:hypothetical protein